MAQEKVNDKNIKENEKMDNNLNKESTNKEIEGDNLRKTSQNNNHKKEKNEIEMIPLEEIIRVSNNFINGEWTEEEMNEYGELMHIRTYIPLLEKTSLVMKILTVFLYQEINACEAKIAELYKNLFFGVILEGYAFIDCSNINLWTYGNYDLLYPIFAPYILGYCEQDYKILESLVKDSINMYNITELVESIEGIDADKLEQSNIDSQEFLKELKSNTELVGDLKDLIMFNDPTNTQMIKDLTQLGEQVIKK